MIACPKQLELRPDLSRNSECRFHFIFISSPPVVEADTLETLHKLRK